MNETLRTTARLLVMLLAAAAAAVVGLELFVNRPATMADLVGILVVIVTVVVVARLAARAVSTVLPTYNVAEVPVEGPITRDGTPSLPRGPNLAAADEIVEQIDRANADAGVKALLVKLNTPGGQVVPSDDIRLAAERFDGPTIAYTTDTCASGGYWIASGCDRVWAREGSIVGSIGVIGSRVNAKGLADRLGLSYERLAAGEYKDAGIPLKEFDADDREYLQGIVDDVYEVFVERVAEGRDMDPEAVRETEARIYLGAEANEIGLVDEIGTQADVEAALETALDEPVRVESFEPQRGLTKRLRTGASGLAFAFGAGLASVAAPESQEWEFRL